MLKEVNLPEIKVLSKKDNKATFVIEPLYSGYGMTIGNSLRRVLLSSLEGAAAVSVKIKGTPHEFSTIPNVKEDVVQIILNPLSYISFFFLFGNNFSLYGQFSCSQT